MKQKNLGLGQSGKRTRRRDVDSFPNLSHWCRRRSNIDHLGVDAVNLVAEAVKLVDPDVAETDFNTAYQSAVGGISKAEVGVPTKRWRELGGPSAATIKGKILLNHIESAAKKRYLC